MIRAAVRAALALGFILATPAAADILIDNVTGMTADENGRVETFSAVLIGDDGRIEQVYDRRDKMPGKVDYRLDARGRVMIPGIIDSHAHVMELGFARLKAKAGFTGTPQGDPRPEDRDLAFSEAQELLLASGITTVTDMGSSIADWQTYRRAGDLGSLRVRVVSYASSVADMVLTAGPRPTPWLYEDRLKMNGLALVLDGVLETRDAWLKSPYADMPDGVGSPRMTAIQLRNLMSRGAIDNFQVAITAHGDAATTAVLDAVEELSQSYSGERRWRIEALNLLDPADLERMARLGIVASVQPQRLDTHHGAGSALIGPARVAGLHRWRSLLDAGTVLVFGTGANAEQPRPFAAMATAITRRGQDALTQDAWQPLEAVTRQQAFAAFTSDAARGILADGRLGRIAKGQRADFLLIDRDPLLATPEELRKTRVLQTWIGGVKVYDADASSDTDTSAGKAAIDSFKER